MTGLGLPYALLNERALAPFLILTVIAFLGLATHDWCQPRGYLKPLDWLLPKK